MKTIKTVLSILSLAAIVTLMAGQNYSYGAAGGPNPWAVNSGARGDRALGPLTIYGEVVDNKGRPGPCGDETQIRSYFFLRVLYENSEQIFTGVSEGTQCHPSDYAGAETVALHEFLKDVMLKLNPDLADEYGGCTPDPFGVLDPTNPCPNILRSFKDVQDSDGALNDDGSPAPLSAIGDVELKIPR